MSRRTGILAVLGCLGWLLASCGGSSTPSTGAGGPGGSIETGPFELLLFSRTQGFRHASIEAGQLAVQQLGAANDFTVTVTEDPTLFNDQTLAETDVVLFLNTTGDVLDDTQQAAFERFMARGGGFVGVHSAADTEYDWAFYGELVGAYFLTHPVVNQPGPLRIEDADHPSTRALPMPWMLAIEEYYSFQSNPADQVRVLMNIDESSYSQTPNISCDPRSASFPDGFSGRMGDHPMAWCHDRLGGRAWYTAIGHEAYLYQDATYQAHLLGGILTAARRVPANCAVRARPEAPAYTPPALEACSNQLSP